MPRRSVPVRADELFDYAPVHRRAQRPTSHTRFQPATGRMTHRARRAVVAASAVACVAPGTARPDSPDVLFWDVVDALLIPGPAPSCPICLDDLCAPRVTRCGHVMDHVCALQLLHHAKLDDIVARCPLCSEKVDVKDLRLVDFLPWSPPTVGGVAKMSLVARPRYSLVARPFSKDDLVEDFARLPRGLRPGSSFFTRLIIADTDYLLDKVAVAIRGLEDTVREDPSLKPFVDAAKATWKTERESLRYRRRAERVSSGCPLLEDGTVPAGRGMTSKNGPVRGTVREPSSSANMSSLAFPLLGSESREPLTSVSSYGERKAQGRSHDEALGDKWPPLEACAHDMPGMYAFYQACDGQRFFLLPLCDRIMKAEFSNLSSGKPTIECPIVDVERHMMDEVLRKRYGFLRHLPLGCEFSFVEVDLCGVVSKETLRSFSAELAERNALRRRRARKSEREDRLAADHEKESLRTYFSLSDDRLAGSREEPNMDSNDDSSFPPMPLTGNSDVSSAGSPEKSSFGISPPRTDAMLWGASVSSYSAATSNMGVFPTLSAVVTATAADRSENERTNLSHSECRTNPRAGLSTSRSMMTPPRIGTGPVSGISQIPSVSSSSSHSPWAGSPSRGTWAPSTSGISPDGSSPRRSGGSHRRGRKQITVLSTAGPQYNRR